MERPRILVTNDDGVHSPGLFALKQALDPFGELTVVAPDRNRTGAARSITMRSPLWVEEVVLPDGSTAFSTDGTPVDCVRLSALGFLEHPPDLIVSGINLGGNLGDDITYSGTVAAAFEGIMLDTPAIAFSAEGYHEGYDLSVAARAAAVVVAQLLAHGFPPKTLLNVNCPDLAWDCLSGFKVTRLGKRIYGDKVQLQETAGNRHRYFVYGDDLRYHDEQGTDFDAIAQGFVSITPIEFELNSPAGLEALATWDLSLRRESARPADERADAYGRPVCEEPPPKQPMLAGLLSRRTEPLVPRPHAVIFDLDGTVVDSVELIVSSFAHAVRTVLGRDLSREELVANVGMPLRQQMALLDPERADELVRVYREFNHREHDRMLKVYDGMQELAAELGRQGRLLGLVTSKSRDTTEMAFRLTGIGVHFGAVVCAEDTEHNKPYPDPLLLAVDTLGVTPAASVYVGDSPYDLQAAHGAGMRSVAVTWGVFDEQSLAAEEPDRLARDLPELRRILGVSAPRS
jgi:5'-nucleotidase